MEAEVLLGTPACTGDGWVRSASTDPLLCAKIPDVRLQPRVIHGRAKLTGGGQLVVQNGMHRYCIVAGGELVVASCLTVCVDPNQITRDSFSSDTCGIWHRRHFRCKCLGNGDYRSAERHPVRRWGRSCRLRRIDTDVRAT